MGRLTCLMAAGALGGLLVPTALAGEASQEPSGKVNRVIASVGVGGAQGTTGRAVARCPKGSRAVSGGWFMTDPEETGLLVFKSRRVRKRGWVTKAIQVTANSFYTYLLAYAYCDDDAQRAKQASTIRTVPSGETRSVAAECPDGRRAVAGGFSVPFDPDFNEGGFPVESRRIGKRTWRVAAHAPNPDGATLTTYAYCGRRVGRLRERSRSSPIGDIGDYRSAGSRQCPKRIGARSGGFSLDDQADALFTIPLSLGEGRRWRVSARNFGGSETVLRSFAYCS